MTQKAAFASRTRFFLCALFAALTPVCTRAENRPNVIVILADDQAWGDLSVNGNMDIATPRIDSLARSGAVLDRFFVSPVCSPTRAEFLTGRYFGRTGVTGVSEGKERLNLDETTIAQIFKSAGYATGAFGKWHNGTQFPYHPNARGFEEFYGFCSGHWGHYFDAEMDHNGEIVKGNGYMADDLTEHAMRFIEGHQKSPFFCYIPYNIPHSPMQVPDRFYAKFDGAPIRQRSSRPQEDDIQNTRAALAMCENIDWNVGRVLDKLDALGLADNTIVVYFSDNGPSHWRWNGGMKGKKGSTDEGGVRVPLLIRWPNHVTAGLKVPQIAGAIDLLPTLVDLAKVPYTPAKPIDGRSLVPLLSAPEARQISWPEREIISMQGGAKKTALSVRSQRFRLDPAGSLFDMEADPGQTRSVNALHPGEAQRLKAIATQFASEIPSGSALDAPRPYTVGFSPTTLLPARDGEAHGTIQRSAKAPNCSYFTHWTKPDDSITWDIEVGEKGTYEALVYYNCKAENVGVEIELGFADAELNPASLKIRATVAEAHDPAPYGPETDRTAREQESDVKDFKPLRLGDIALPAERGKLVLRAPKIPGTEAIEVRYVVLRKLTRSL
ncbi:MAG: N-acetylgalactosamine 6-sulfate sulfatase [Verrucomicrobia bacterium]|nr:N-acetylgalactosamine 6-sulfate sulfatase [Verrucomicrobiota bacterium]